MTLSEAIEQLTKIGKGDNQHASQARQLVAWLKELRELRNKMRVLEPLFGKEQIENLRREVKKARESKYNAPQSVIEEPKTSGLSSTIKRW